MTLHPTRPEPSNPRLQRSTKAPDSSAHKTRHSPAKPLRVTLIDADELTARGLASMLREHPTQIELVSMSAPRIEPVDIALYDHAGGNLDDEATLAQLLCDAHIRKVALFTWNYKPWTAADLISQGASAYLSKAMTSRELIQALCAVHTNVGPVCPQASTRTRMAPRAERGEVLSEREAQMLSYISSGLSNTEIADTLNLSVNTVKSYIRSCYRKIDVESRSKAVLWGIGHGFGGSPGPASPQIQAGTSAAPSTYTPIRKGFS